MRIIRFLTIKLGLSGCKDCKGPTRSVDQTRCMMLKQQDIVVVRERKVWNAIISLNVVEFLWEIGTLVNILYPFTVTVPRLYEQFENLMLLPYLGYLFPNQVFSLRQVNHRSLCRLPTYNRLR